MAINRYLASFEEISLKLVPGNAHGNQDIEGRSGDKQYGQAPLRRWRLTPDKSL